MPMEAIRKFARAVFEWSGWAKASVATDKQRPISLDGFPQLVEIIPGKLKVRIFLHEIEYEQEKLSCWSFVTDGLWPLKQKEIIFTIRRDANQKPMGYPAELLDLLVIIFHLAERGQLVDIGDSSLFDENGLSGNSTVRGIGYVEPQGFPGVETRGAPLLAGIFLKNDEAQIAWKLGLTRVIALIGMKYRYYPCPTWSDLKREPLASLPAMAESLLGKITRVGVHATYYDERNHIFLFVFPSSRANLQKVLGEMPSTMPLALCTQPDPRANACLVWSSGQKQTAAITPSGSDGSRKTGAFLAFVPEQAANEIRMIEDGFSVFLTNSAWQMLREALLSGTDTFLPPAGVGAASISIEWAKPTTYRSPVSGESFTADRWTTYTPDPRLPPKERVAVSSSRVVLLTSEQELQARATVKDLAGYLNAIEKEVDAFFTPVERRTQCEITIRLALTPTGHEVGFKAMPDLSAIDAEALHKRLQNVAAPRVAGPVKFESILRVWSVAGKQ